MFFIGKAGAESFEGGGEDSGDIPWKASQEAS